MKEKSKLSKRRSKFIKEHPDNSLDKSEIAFSSEIQHDFFSFLIDKLGIRSVDKHVVYLGLPVVIDRSKKKILGPIEGRVAQNLKN